MATVKKGMTVSSLEWWKHLRWTKRPFWKRQRAAFKRETKTETRYLHDEKRK